MIAKNLPSVDVILGYGYGYECGIWMDMDIMNYSFFGPGFPWENGKKTTKRHDLTFSYKLQQISLGMRRNAIYQKRKGSLDGTVGIYVNLLECLLIMYRGIWMELASW